MTGDFETMRLAVADGIARLTFIDAARGNPIDGRFCAEFCEAATRISERRDVRAVLITAEGKAFSYGGDIASFIGDLDTLPLMIKRWTTDLHSGVARLQRMDAPILAAVHGVCAGGMSGVVAGSDIVIARADARFVAAYAGIAFSCDAGSSAMYTRRMGPGAARRFLLLNQTFDAAAALEAGLADEVVSAETFSARAEALVAALEAGRRVRSGRCGGCCCRHRSHRWKPSWNWRRRRSRVVPRPPMRARG